jgi:hypothetical protein
VKNYPGDLGAILQRIDHLLKVTRLSERAAGRAVGAPDYIHSMSKQYAAGTQFSCDPKKLRRLVEPLNTTWDFLWAGVGEAQRTRGRPRRTNGLQVRRDRGLVLSSTRALKMEVEGALNRIVKNGRATDDDAS